MSHPPQPTGDYARLTAHLAARSEPRLMLTFAEIEGIVGELLPLQAKLQAQWWQSGYRGRAPHGFAWQAAGWQVDLVDTYTETVTFARESAE